MIDEENVLTIGALLKWKNLESLSIRDTERIIRLFEVADLKVDIPDQQVVAGLQTRMRSILASKYLPNK